MVSMHTSGWNERPQGRDAQLEEKWQQWAAAQEAWWKERAAGQAEEFLRQSNLMYGGLIGIGIVMVQQFLTATPAVFDLAARICVVAFSVAIPILAALFVLNSQEMYRRRATASAVVLVARSIAFVAGFTGVVAGFWHITPIAGAGVLIAAVVGMAVHSIGYVRVERDDAEATAEGTDPEGTSSA